MTRGGQAHAGEVAGQLGLGGWPALGESLMVGRDVALARETGRPLHLMHLSATESVEHLRRAQATGARATAEVTPHHLVPHRRGGALARPELQDEPTAAQRRPSRRAHRRIARRLDRRRRDGSRPALGQEKDVPFESAPFGVIGLETAFPALYTYLVEPGVLSLETVLERMSAGPAAIFGIDRPRIAIGVRADLVLLDLQATLARPAVAAAVAFREFLAARQAPARPRPSDRRRRPRGARRVMSGCSCSRTAASSPANPSARCGSRVRRSGVHDRDERLPGGRHRSQLRGADRLLHGADGRQLRRRRRALRVEVCRMRGRS